MAMANNEYRLMNRHLVDRDMKKRKVGVRTYSKYVQGNSLIWHMAIWLKSTVKEKVYKVECMASISLFDRDMDHWSRYAAMLLRIKRQQLNNELEKFRANPSYPDECMYLDEMRHRAMMAEAL